MVWPRELMEQLLLGQTVLKQVYLVVSALFIVLLCKANSPRDLGLVNIFISLVMPAF